ncbi:rhomboid family intramembrane serine protease [Ekhidna sp. MALMAid0563]|uniref:rhomboid family intramembrane serine protease n=1 Tax=Ekhidna sp. MALMAid0563 TaxID=3143937 RepID=UPI0032DE49E8
MTVLKEAITFCLNLLFLLFASHGIGQFVTTDSLLLKPGDTTHIIGILTSSLLHENTEHLIYNAIGLGGFYFFLIIEKELTRPIRASLLFIIISNLVVFFFGDPSYYYLGSSNLVYALAGFSIGSVVINKKYKLLIPLIFLGGLLINGMIMGNTGVSFISHYFGLILGIGYFILKEYIQPLKIA